VYQLLRSTTSKYIQNRSTGTKITVGN